MSICYVVSDDMTNEFLVLVNHIFVAVLVDCLLLLLILLLCTKR